MRLIRGLTALPVNALRAAVLMMDEAQGAVLLRLQTTKKRAQEMKLRLAFFSEINITYPPNVEDETQQGLDNLAVSSHLETKMSKLLNAWEAIGFLKTKLLSLLNANHLATQIPDTTTPPLTVLKPSPLKKNNSHTLLIRSATSHDDDIPTDDNCTRSSDGSLNQQWERSDSSDARIDTQGDESEAETVTSRSSGSS